MIASHNSMSYLPPTKLWMAICKPWSKCQKDNIEAQLDKGVRYFDIRIRPWKDGDTYVAHYCHNTIDYGIADLTKSFDLIDKASLELNGVNFFVRVTLDVRKKPNDADEMAVWFKTYVNNLQEKYPNIIFDSIKIFWDWGNDLSDENVTVTEKHWSVVDKKWYEYILPIKWFAKMHNKSYIKEYEKEHILDNPDNIALMIDYIM
jgi:hypothetical protein